MRLSESISAALEAGGIVVASSSRAARALRRHDSEARREEGLSAWRAAEIVDWDGWLDRLWQQGLRSGQESRVLLSSAQEHRIWVRLATPSIEGRRLISIDGVADLAQEAYRRLSLHDALEFLRGEIFGGPDIESFRSWAREFEHLCREQGWLSRSMLPLALCDAAAREGWALPRSALPTASLPLTGPLMLVGFDRFRPAEQRLLTAWEEAGCLVQHFESSYPPPSVPKLVEAGSSSEEIAVCAHWVRRTLELTATEKKKPRIAVMAADARSMRGEVERVFRQVLAPQTVSVSSPEPPLPFEFSLGAPLAQVPMVRAALMLLRWMVDGVSQQEASWLTLSGFFWQEESELLPLAEFDAEMRRGGILAPEQDLDSYLFRKGWGKNAASLGLRNRLYAARRAWRVGRSSPLSFSQWAERAEAILAAAGWPGPNRLLGEDFEARAKWGHLLTSVATLTLDGPAVSYREFLHVLEHEAGRTIFSAQSHGAPVQILGPFEAAGMEFDAIWFLGADDRSWPAPGRPHPFLTQALQRQKSMPHADNNSDWELAKLVTERIQKSAPICIFSYAARDKDGRRRPAAVFHTPPEVISAARMLEQLAVAKNILEEEREFPPLEEEEEPASGIVWSQKRAAGGHDVLKLQAACPFRAFARFRLSAREFGQRDWGLDAMERGQLLHTVLQGIWDELKDHRSLIEASSEGRLRAIIERHVSRALAKYGGSPGARPAALSLDEPPDVEGNGEGSGEGYGHDFENRQNRWNRAYLQAEYERVVRLVESWLAYEQERPSFTVEECERSLTAQVGELELKLRADRIDRVQSAGGGEGGRLLIDYKSGDASPAAWRGERPDDPQLPLYAAYGNVAGLRGVLFAHLRAGEMKFEGSVAGPGLIHGGSGSTHRDYPPPYSQKLEKQWAEALLALATQFAAGKAGIDPKSYPKTCDFCAFPGLCRVAENQRKPTEDEASDFSFETAGGNEE